VQLPNVLQSSDKLKFAEKSPRQTSAAYDSPGRLAVFNVEQVTLNRHVQIIERAKAKARAKQRRLFESRLRFSTYLTWSNLLKSPRPT
jgi:hypothetical protein